MMFLCSLLAVAAAALSPSDLARAHLPVPLPSSHVVGGNPTQIFAAMNRHLLRQPHHTQPCEEYTHEELNDLARVLWGFREPELAAIYDNKGDNRKFHFDAEEDGLDYKEKLWAEENLLTATKPEKYGEGTQHHKMVRDGKCAELVMWWIHHLNAADRTTLSAREGFKVPLLPAVALTPVEENIHSKEYTYQVQCSDCHSTGLKKNATAATKKPALRSKEAVDDVPPGTCPIVKPLVGKSHPSVWYEPMSDVGNRKKRCDWDYDPPCGLCEGIGGYSWGDQEHDINYIDCKPVALAKDIPKDNRTVPVWPKAFVANEVTTLINQLGEAGGGGQFPGADPCANHKFENDTEVFYYDDSRVNFPGPIMYTNCSKTAIYTLPTADMFIKIDNAFCICVTPYQNGNKSQPATGPLEHDFAHDAVLIGREIIGLESLGTSVEADHWNKGPHHFWVSTETGKFVRGWQPWNGLNVYIPGTWQVGPVAKELFAIPESCYKGLLHKNISCAFPYDPSRGY